MDTGGLKPIDKLILMNLTLVKTIEKSTIILTSSKDGKNG